MFVIRCLMEQKSDRCVFCVVKIRWRTLSRLTRTPSTSARRTCSQHTPSGWAWPSTSPSSTTKSSTRPSRPALWPSRWVQFECFMVMQVTDRWLRLHSRDGAPARQLLSSWTSDSHFLDTIVKHQSFQTPQ